MLAIRVFALLEITVATVAVVGTLAYGLYTGTEWARWLGLGTLLGVEAYSLYLDGKQALKEEESNDSAS